MLCTDNGSAYCSQEVEQWLAERGVLHLKSLPRTPQHNAQAERAIGLLKQAAEIGPAGAPITSCTAAATAVQRGLERLAGRPRGVLGNRTSPTAHETTPRWYTRARRMEVYDDARRARDETLRDHLGARARRRADRRAILDTLQRHQLISRTRGGEPLAPLKGEEES